MDAALIILGLLALLVAILLLAYAIFVKCLPLVEAANRGYRVEPSKNWRRID